MTGASRARWAISSIALLLSACTTGSLVMPTPGGTSATSPGATAVPLPQPAVSPLASTPVAPPWPAGGGGLDATFGDGGTVATDMGGSDDSARGVVVDSAGSVTVVGEARRDANSLRSFALTRYLPDGTVDAGFGDGGRVHTPFGEFQGAGAHAAVLQRDGMLVVVGLGRHPEVFHDTFAVARYHPDGTLDASFGSGGQVLTAIDPETGAGRNDIAHAVTVDPEGRILVTGQTGGLFMDFATVRYLPDGTPDPAFGDGGIVVTDLGGDDRANAIAVQGDGAILVGGSGWRTSGAEDFALVRYTSQGEIDATFGEGGIVTLDFRGGSDRGQGIALGSDGKIILGGVVQLSGGCSPNPCERYGFGATRHLPDGKLDAAFGEGGLVHPDFLTSSGAYATARLSDGTVGLAGHIGNEDFGLAFLGPTGLISVGGGAAARIDFAGGSDRAFAAAPGPGRTIVIAGDTLGTDGAMDFAVARYEAPAEGTP